MKTTWLAVLLSAVLSSCGQSSGSNGSSSSLSNPNDLRARDSATIDPADFKLSCEEARFIKLLNIYRESLGQTTLVVSKSAVIVARWHAQDMIDKNYFDHNEPSGRNPWQRAQAFNASISGENIAAGNGLAANTFCQWKNSTGHNANMLSSGFKSAGIGLAEGGSYRFYWSSNFGGTINDALSEPLTSDATCTMPVALPGC